MVQLDQDEIEFDIDIENAAINKPAEVKNKNNNVVVIDHQFDNLKNRKVIWK